MATYSNLNGTTQSSFKIGANGVLLKSSAVENFNQKFLLTNQTDSQGNQLRIAFEKTGEDPLYTKFDSFISSSEISRISYSDSGVTFHLKTGETIVINPGASGVTGPNSSTNNAIALFDGIGGNTIKDSQTTISNSISTEASAANNKIVPTVEAVIGYFGDITDILKDRLNGTV